MNVFLWYDSKNWIFFEKIKELNLFFSRIWLKELNSFEMTKRIEPLFMNLFSIWLKELKSFFQYDAKNWTFLVFQYDSKNWIFFFNLTQRIVCFYYMTQRVELLFWNLTLRIEPFYWVWWTFLLSMTQRIELFEFDSNFEPFFIEYDSKSWTSFWVWLNFFLSMTQRKELLEKRLKELIFFFLKNVRKKWTSKKKEFK